MIKCFICIRIRCTFVVEKVVYPMNKVLPFLLLLFVFTSCSRKYKIEGASSVTSLDGKMLFIKVLQNGEWLNIDSAEVVHGLFSMKGKVDSVVMATLYR